MVRSVGAHDVIDDRVEDFTRRGERYDVIFDVGGNRPLAHCRRVMARHGVLVAVGGPAGRWLEPAGRMVRAGLLSLVVSQRVVPFISKNDVPGLTLLAELASARTISPVIHRRYALADAPEAIRQVGEGRARGKVTLAVR